MQKKLKWEPSPDGWMKFNAPGESVPCREEDVDGEQSGLRCQGGVRKRVVTLLIIKFGKSVKTGPLGFLFWIVWIR
jgi:hypothetical protein